MPVIFQGGQSMPAQGTAAFTSAQQGAGTGNFNAATNTLSVAPISPTAVQTNPSASTVSAPPKTTPVVTSQAAQDDYNEKLANFNQLITNLEAHTTAKNQAQAEAQAKQAQDDLNKSKLNLEQQGIDIKKSEADTKAKALSMASDEGSTPPQSSTTPTTATNGTDTVQTANTNIQNANTSNDTAQNDIIDQKTQAFTNFQQQVSQIMTGTFPLSAPEQALISSVQASLERQKASVIGVETEAAARSGQEYTPAQAAGMIANKVMDLDNMAAGTIAQLKLAFGKQDYEMINSTYDKQTKLLDDKSLAIQKLHDTVVANEKDIRDQAQKVTENINKIAEDVAKNGGTPEQVAKVQGSKSEGEAINNAGDMLQSATGTLGDYLQYKRETISKGLVPKDYTTFKNDQLRTEETIKNQARISADNANTSSDKTQQKLEQQYRGVLSKEFSSRTGSLGIENMKVNQANHLNSLFSQYYDPKTGNYNVPKAQYAEAVLGLANLISPTGVASDSLRESIMSKTAKGDLNGALQYVTGVPQNGNTQEIIKNLIDSVDRQAETATRNREAALQNMRDQAPTDLEQSRIDKLNKGTEMVKYEGQERVSKNNIANYLKNNPSDTEKLAQMAEQPGATPESIEKWLKDNGKINE